MKLFGWHRPNWPGVVCQQWVEIVTDYLEGALPLDLQEAADRHLADCPHCREYLRQVRRIVEVSGRLRDADVPAEVVNALAMAFEDFQPGR